VLAYRRQHRLSIDGIGLTDRGALATDRDKMTGRPGVFAAGDAARGQSLIVTAIA